MAFTTQGSPLPLRRDLDKAPFLKHGDDVRVWVEGCGELLRVLPIRERS